MEEGEHRQAPFNLFGLPVYRREMEMPLSTKGIVVCLFLFVLNLAAAIEIPLSVRQLPTITEQSTSEVGFPFDEEFTIKCEAKGNPPPIFNWTKDGKPFDLQGDSRIVTSRNSGTFIIRNHGSTSVFQGKYRCYAGNEVGTAVSEEVELIVPGIPKFPKEMIDPIEVEHGDSMVLPCNPPKGIPPLHIYWMNIDLQHIPQDERVSMSLKGDLYFANVDENDSRSDYCCFAAFPRLRTIAQKMSMKLTVTRCKENVVVLIEDPEKCGLKKRDAMAVSILLMQMHGTVLEPGDESDLGLGLLPSQQMDTRVNRPDCGLSVP
ncbi:hypothetical protein lerEdw1_015642 [Lerista edwardsae]|nr:hypothetical protein lerEdw1_015642 [Lerista edwardsae]